MSYAALEYLATQIEEVSWKLEDLIGVLDNTVAEIREHLDEIDIGNDAKSGAQHD